MEAESSVEIEEGAFDGVKALKVRDASSGPIDKDKGKEDATATLQSQQERSEKLLLLYWSKVTCLFFELWNQHRSRTEITASDSWTACFGSPQSSRDYRKIWRTTIRRSLASSLDPNFSHRVMLPGYHMFMINCSKLWGLRNPSKNTSRSSRLNTTRWMNNLPMVELLTSMQGWGLRVILISSSDHLLPSQYIIYNHVVSYYFEVVEDGIYCDEESNIGVRNLSVFNLSNLTQPCFGILPAQELTGDSCRNEDQVQTSADLKLCLQLNKWHVIRKGKQFLTKIDGKKVPAPKNPPKNKDGEGDKPNGRRRPAPKKKWWSRYIVNHHSKNWGLLNLIPLVLRNSELWKTLFSNLNGQ